MVSDKALSEFITIWKEEFGNDLPKEEATLNALSLLTLFNTIYHPVKKEWLEELGLSVELNTKKRDNGDASHSV